MGRRRRGRPRQTGTRRKRRLIAGDRTAVAAQAVTRLLPEPTPDFHCPRRRLPARLPRPALTTTPRGRAHPSTPSAPRPPQPTRRPPGRGTVQARPRTSAVSKAWALPLRRPRVRGTSIARPAGDVPARAAPRSPQPAPRPRPRGDGGTGLGACRRARSRRDDLLNQGPGLDAGPGPSAPCARGHTRRVPCFPRRTSDARGGRREPGDSKRRARLQRRGSGTDVSARPRGSRARVGRGRRAGASPVDRRPGARTGGRPAPRPLPTCVGPANRRTGPKAPPRGRRGARGR